MYNLQIYNTIFRGQQLQYPLTELTFKWIGRYDGNDLVNEIGVNIPYVSGTGLDAIYDFSVLNDDRFDKGSYIGNSFGLPEYYDFPYVNIYYDSTNATTRKYWKLPDFHYANLETQSINLTNWAFLKAKATTDISNVIDTIQELLIYSTLYDEITCYSSGTIYKESTQAYGLVFDAIINKDGGLNPYINFINNNNLGSVNGIGYQLELRNTNQIFLRIIVGSGASPLFFTAASYINNAQNYRYLIWRNETENQYVTGDIGTFAVYIQGKNKAITTTEYTAPNLDEMELIDATGGSGSNPVTNNTYVTSAYKVYDLNAGNKLSILGEDFSVWTEGTGKYAHYNNGEQTNGNLTRLRNYSNLYLYLGIWTYKS